MSDVSRRDALRRVGAASLGIFVPSGTKKATLALGQPTNARHIDRETTAVAPNPPNGVKQSVARWCFEDIPLGKFCAEVATMGLPAIDLLKVDEWGVAHDQQGLPEACKNSLPL